MFSIYNSIIFVNTVCLYIITLTPIFRTTGDGNCLYNACSIASCGTENLAPYLHALSYKHRAFCQLPTLC